MVCAAKTEKAQAEVVELMEAVRAGSADSRPKLYELLLPWCAFHVSDAGGKTANETQREEAEAECKLALVETVERIAADPTIENVTEYITKAIRSRARRALRSQACVSVKKSTANTQKNKPPTKRYVIAEPLSLSDADTQLRDWSHTTTFADDPTGTDTWEELQKCCVNDKDRQLVSLLASGLSMDDAAVVMKRSVVALCYRRQRILDRYEERNGVLR